MDFSLIPVELLFVLTVLANVAFSSFQAVYVKKRLQHNSDYYLLNVGSSLFCMLALMLLSGFQLQCSAYTLLLGVLFGVATMIASVSRSKALKVGPWSYTTVIICASTVFTAISGWLFWQESLSIWKILGIILMFFCCCFAIDRQETEKKKFNLSWLIFCLIAMVCVTLIGIMQKIHQTSKYQGELMPFLVVAFLVSALGSLAMYFIYRCREEKIAPTEKKKMDFWRLFLFVSAVYGLATAGNNAINLYLSGVVDAAIMFPIVNGIPLVLNVALSFVLFKEKLTKKQWIGFILGFASVVCLSLGI